MTDSEIKATVFEQVNLGFDHLYAQAKILNLSFATIVAHIHGHPLTLSKEPIVFLDLLQFTDDLIAADRRPAARAVVEALLACTLSPEQREEVTSRLLKVASDKADVEAAEEHIRATRDAHQAAMDEAREIAQHNLEGGRPERSMSGESFEQLRWSGGWLLVLLARFDEQERETHRQGIATLLAALRSAAAFAEVATRLMQANQHTGAYAVASLAANTLPSNANCRILRGWVGLHTGLAPAHETLADLPLLLEKLTPGDPMRQNVEALLTAIREQVTSLEHTVAAGGPRAAEARDLLDRVSARV